MSSYNRKGGSGKSGSLREQFTYYKKQVRNRLIKEQSLNIAYNSAIEPKPSLLFTNLDYNKIYEDGITRKVKNVTTRFFGAEAVKIQIKSLANRASKSYQTDRFIENYIQTASSEKVGFSDELVDYIEKTLKSISIDRLSLLIKRGVIPQIKVLYAYSEDEDEFKERFTNAIKYGHYNAEAQKISQEIIDLKSQPTLSKGDKKNISLLTKKLNEVNRTFLKSLKQKAKEIEKSVKNIFDIQGW